MGSDDVPRGRLGRGDAEGEGEDGDEREEEGKGWNGENDAEEGEERREGGGYPMGSIIATKEGEAIWTGLSPPAPPSPPRPSPPSLIVGSSSSRIVTTGRRDGEVGGSDPAFPSAAVPSSPRGVTAEEI